jgi:hypothetical protein
MIYTRLLVRWTGSRFRWVDVARTVVGDVFVQDSRHRFVGSRKGVDGVSTPELADFCRLLIV